MRGKKVLVVGGGFGGAAAARTARALLQNKHQITLVDRSRRTYLCGSFPLLLVGERKAINVSRSLGSLESRGVRYLEAEVRSINMGSKTAATSAGTLGYDFLILAPGATYDWNAVSGSRNAYSFYELKMAQRLRRKLASFRKGRIVIAVSSIPYKCPPAPFEAAMILDWSFKLRGVRRDIEIHLFTPELAPLAIAGPEASAQLLKDLALRDIHLHTNKSVTGVDDYGQQAAFSDGASINYDLLIIIPKHRTPSLIDSMGLVGDSGWVSVSPKTLETTVPDIFAIGDVNTLPMTNGLGLPKTGVFASAEGETVGQNIAAAINGSETTVFSGLGHCFIAYSGTQAGLIKGDFLAAGKPNVRLQRATARGFKSKERFESDWRRFKI